MVGRVLDYEAKTIWTEGRNEGRMEKRAENERHNRQRAIRFILKQRDLQSPESMADSAEVDVSLVNRVCHIAEKDPDVKPEVVYDMLDFQRTIKPQESDR